MFVSECVYDGVVVATVVVADKVVEMGYVAGVGLLQKHYGAVVAAMK